MWSLPAMAGPTPTSHWRSFSFTPIYNFPLAVSMGCFNGLFHQAVSPARTTPKSGWPHKAFYQAARLLGLLGLPSLLCLSQVSPSSSPCPPSFSYGFLCPFDLKTILGVLGHTFFIPFCPLTTDAKIAGSIFVFLWENDWTREEDRFRLRRQTPKSRCGLCLWRSTLKNHCECGRKSFKGGE